jgi:hypothetical protein
MVASEHDNKYRPALIQALNEFVTADIKFYKTAQDPFNYILGVSKTGMCLLWSSSSYMSRLQPPTFDITDKLFVLSLT